MASAAAPQKNTTPRPRGPRPARGRPTRERILDAAEKLFARRGFHGVSVRDITQDAGVDVALVNYHFGSKQALLDSVLTRRSEVLNAERMQLLRKGTVLLNFCTTIQSIRRNFNFKKSSQIINTKK